MNEFRWADTKIDKHSHMQFRIDRMSMNMEYWKWKSNQKYPELNFATDQLDRLEENIQVVQSLTWNLANVIHECELSFQRPDHLFGFINYFCSIKSKAIVWGKKRHVNFSLSEQNVR